MRKYVEKLLQTQSETVLQRITIIGKSEFSRNGDGIRISSYEPFLKDLAQNFDDTALAKAQRNVHPSDLLNLQFTSGKCQVPGLHLKSSILDLLLVSWYALLTGLCLQARRVCQRLLPSRIC